MTDGRQMPNYEKSSHGLWSGELSLEMSWLLYVRTLNCNFFVKLKMLDTRLLCHIFITLILWDVCILKISVKILKGRNIKGICAGRFHSVIYTDNAIQDVRSGNHVRVKRSLIYRWVYHVERVFAGRWHPTLFLPQSYTHWP